MELLLVPLVYIWNAEPGAPGLAAFETRARQDPSLWKSRQIQNLQFLYIP